MKNAILTLALFAVSSIAAPAPYPVTINSRAQTAPPLTVYRAAESLFRVSFVDGDTASDITGTTAFMSFATNATAAVVSTASVSVVAGMTGVVDCVFSPAAVNVTAGRYMYEVGVTPNGGTARIYRQGVFTVAASPYAGSAAAVTWATNMTWGTINWTGLPDWLLVSETSGWETGSHAGFVTNSADFYPVSNPSNYITIADVPAQTSQIYVASAGTVTGSQSNLIDTALQSEADPVALAALAEHAAYWPPNATASSRFTFITNSGAITITGYNIAGGTDVVIPDYINGWPVTSIGNYVFHSLNNGDEALLSIVFPRGISYLGDEAFMHCSELTNFVFSGNAPTVGVNTFYIFNPSIVATVINPLATGWGKTLSDTGTESYEQRSIPVVRLPLHADAIYQAGELVATTQHVAQAIADEAAMRADADTSITGSLAAVSGALVSYTNALPVAGNTLIELTDVTNIVLTGATYAYRAMPDVAYRLSVPTNAPAVHYGITILSTNACTLSENLLMRGTKTVTGTNCVAFQPWTNGTWEVMWGGK